MRIKFKACLKDSGEIVRVKALSLYEKVYYKSKGELVDVAFDDCILLRNTGLIDNCDREIYEGDIVKTPRYFGRVIYCNELAEFQVAPCVGEQPFKNDFYPFSLGSLMDVIVVGNEYEQKYRR